MSKYLTLLCAVMLISTVHTQASTNISGQIRTNTTWTKAGSPYILSGLVEIAPNTTLTVAPGVTIISDTRIDVYGDLILKGAYKDTIYIKSQPGKYWQGINYYNHRDSINLEYCKLEGSAIGISLYKSKVNVLRIHHCLLNDFFLTVPNNFVVDTLDIQHCHFARTNTIHNSNTPGISAYDMSFVLLKHNIIEGSVMLTRIDAAQIYYNDISQGRYGIVCGVKRPDIAYNSITNTKERALDLIYCVLEADNNPCRFNIITNNHGIGININSTSGLITENSIYKNNIGIAHSFVPGTDSPLVFKYNCIYNNDSVDFYSYSGANYHVAENWWGTTDSTTIEGHIYDYIDDFKKGRVTFLPLMQQPDSACKQYSPPPTAIKDQIKSTATIQAYPNPFAQSFTIRSSGNIKQISVYNLVGKLMTSMQVNDQQEITLDASRYPSGIYIYNVLTEDGLPFTGRLVKR